MDQQTEGPQRKPDGSEGYVQSSPSPTKDNRKLTVLVVAVVVIVVLSILFGALYYVAFGLRPPTPPYSFCWPTGSVEVEATGPTTADMTFVNFECEPEPTELFVVLENSTAYGKYIFPSNADGVTLILESEYNMVATITYRDATQNGKVNSGDGLLLTNLGPGSDYTIRIYWAHNGDLISSEDF